jgi:hypothetical protein
VAGFDVAVGIGALGQCIGDDFQHCHAGIADIVERFGRGAWINNAGSQLCVFEFVIA